MSRQGTFREALNGWRQVLLGKMSKTSNSTADGRDGGLNIKCTSLAKHLVPSKKSELQKDKLIEQGQAKQFLKTYVPKGT